MSLDREIIESEIDRIVSSFWGGTLSLTTARLEEVGAYDPPELSSSSNVDTIAISISGAWNGELTLDMDCALARCVTAKIYDLEETVIIELPQLEDALREITNVLAGNLKTVLPEPCILGLPKFSEHSLCPLQDDTNRLLRFSYICLGKFFTVTLRFLGDKLP